ncbi:MAG: Flp pilus assembly complex ATPase component TadA [Bdellovibrionales bacterium]|nr:Flp pilus assembly complex ATPase component TadA [Bdellovibrionales bacterium]
MQDLKSWVRLGKEKSASDIHLEAGTHAVFRIRGELVAVDSVASPASLRQMAQGLLSDDGWQDFLQRGSADLSRTLSGVRCRIHIFQTNRGIGFAIRLLSSFQNSLLDCNLHPDFQDLVKRRTGLILISGPTGSGKSTTLAALIEEINQTQARHVVTLESPIEYFFSNRRSYIRQREIPTHSPSFDQAIVDSMRENPDVLVIGEIRTPEAMRLTLNAAETGHLVIATLHSATSAEALSRICMSFPSELQASIRAQLADCLIGVICQRLTFHPAAQLRVPVCEVLMANTGAKTLIRSGQFSQILSVLQAGGEEGMWTFERYQKWIEQKKTWIRPADARPLEDTVEPSAQERTVRRRPLPNTQNEEKADDGSLEIGSIEDDLESLAKRIR